MVRPGEEVFSGDRQEPLPQYLEAPLHAEAERILSSFSAMLCGSLELT
jgi:hypothetical protein